MTEVVSPGNKSSAFAIRELVEQSRQFLEAGIHLLIVDLFSPTSRDPQGIHKAIWDYCNDEPFELPADKPLTLASYVAGLSKKAYVEPVAVGDTLPGTPIFLDFRSYVSVPLEEMYLTTSATCPEELKQRVLLKREIR